MNPGYVCTLVSVAKIKMLKNDPNKMFMIIDHICEFYSKKQNFLNLNKIIESDNIKQKSM